MQILIIYDSKTGNTEKMTFAVAEGARETGGVEVVVKKVDETTNEDLLKADGIIVGSPTYYGQMSAKSKQCLTSQSKFTENWKVRWERRLRVRAGLPAAPKPPFSRFWKPCLSTGWLFKGELTLNITALPLWESQRSERKKDVENWARLLPVLS